MNTSIKTLLSLLITINSIHHSSTMCQQINPLDSKQINPISEVPDIYNRFMHNFFPHSFSKADKPKAIRDHLMSMSLVSRGFNQLINSIPMTQAIIDNLSNKCNQDYWAKKISTPGMINYLKKSNTLHKHINAMNVKRVQRLLNQGADPNYFPRRKCPLLFRLLNTNKANPKKMDTLLKKGANANVAYRDKTVLQNTVEKNYLALANSILAYNPENKCLSMAIFQERTRMVELILKPNNIPVSMLNNALKFAIAQDNKSIINAILNAGADAKKVIADIEKTIYGIV